MCKKLSYKALSFPSLPLEKYIENMRWILVRSWAILRHQVRLFTRDVTNSSVTSVFPSVVLTMGHQQGGVVSYPGNEVSRQSAVCTVSSTLDHLRKTTAFWGETQLLRQRFGISLRTSNPEFLLCDSKKSFLQ